MLAEQGLRLTLNERVPRRIANDRFKRLKDPALREDVERVEVSRKVKRVIPPVGQKADQGFRNFRIIEFLESRDDERG